MFVIDGERIPIRIWADEVDDGTLAQARNLANLPFAFSHVALMADAHVGFGMPIGGVLAALGQVSPHAVGLDIGCGVRAWDTGVPVPEFMTARDEIMHDVMRSVPQGHFWHKASQAERTDLFDRVPDVAVLRAEIEKAQRQIGSLGGGNHFVEVQRAPNGLVWAMVHSGSRNVGKQMAEHYNRIARAENERQNSPVPLEWGLAHLAIDSPGGEEYLEVMGWCLEFARESRRLMAESVKRAIERRFPGSPASAEHDVHHNYAVIEEHFGETVVVHRKGAVRADGIVFVPGSMGSASYVCRGLANPLAFESCAHGAGRAMGRKQAVRTLRRETVLAQMASRGVGLYKAKLGDVAEEAPEAYKDIEDVMRHQSDLVEPLLRLEPLGVMKG